MGKLSWSKTHWTERFWNSVPVPVGDECMEWMKSRHPHGYGLARAPFFKGQRHASRIMWAMINGPIPKGMVVRHTCDNPPCVRPDHLVIGTQKQNVQDCIERGRFAIGGHKTIAYIKGTK